METEATTTTWSPRLLEVPCCYQYKSELLKVAALLHIFLFPPLNFPQQRGKCLPVVHQQYTVWSMWPRGMHVILTAMRWLFSKQEKLQSTTLYFLSFIFRISRFMSLFRLKYFFSSPPFCAVYIKVQISNIFPLSENMIFKWYLLWAYLLNSVISLGMVISFERASVLVHF